MTIQGESTLNPSKATVAPRSIWIGAHQLDSSLKERMVEKARSIPRPPQAMQQLLSEAFINQATSADLSALVRSDPAVAAKVIATVNSPLYNLRTPVQTLGQAITFMGVNQFRGLCIQLMLADSFKSLDPRVGTALDAVWQSNRAAGVLLPKLTVAYSIDNAATLTSKVILSFVGQLAMTGLMPPGNLPTWGRLGRLMRLRMEHGFVGINATELGALILRHWQIPDELICDVVAMDRVLVDPLESSTAADPISAATGYVCVWMAEQIARGLGSASVSPWDPVDTDEPELQAWLTYGELPGMAVGTDSLRQAPMQALYTQIRNGCSG